MADPYQIVAVPGVGHVQFPTSMSDDDIGTAIKKNYPELDSLNKTAAAKNSQRLSTQLGSLYPSIQPSTPKIRTSTFTALPDASIATPEGNARRSAIWDFQDRADAGSRAAGVPLSTPDTSQDLNRNSQLMRTMTSGERDAAYAKTQLMPGTPDAKIAQDALAQHGTEGMNPILGEAADTYRKYAQTPYLGPAIDEAVQGVRRAFHDPMSGGPGPLTPINPNDPAEHVGTQMIPQLLARRTPAPGTMEPNEPWYKAAPRAAGRGVYDAAQGLSTPESMALAAGFGIAPNSAAAKLAQGIFTGEAIKGAGEGAYSGGKKLIGGDVYGGIQDLTGAAVNSLFGALGGAEMFHDTRARVASDAVRNDPAPIKAAEADRDQAIKQASTPAIPPEEKPLVATPKIDMSKFPKVQQAASVGATSSATTTDTPQALSAPEPQAENPSPKAADLEPNIRQVAGTVLRIKQLSDAAKNRLDVEYALHAVRGVDTPEHGASDPAAKLLGNNKENANPLADSRKAPAELSKDRQQIVQTVSDILGKTPEDLYEANYRLTDAEVKRLKQLRSQGLRPVSIAGTGHPEEAFGSDVPHLLADINFANAKAAGIPNAKDLWSQLSEKDQAARKAFKGYEVSGPSEEDLRQNISTSTEGGEEGVRKAITSSERGAKQSGEITVARKDAATLQFEHDMLQKVLSKRLKQAKDKLTSLVPDWRQARIGETEPSQLSQQISALSPESQKVLPKELYAKEHLTTKAGQSSTSPVVQESVSTTQAPEIGKTPEIAAPAKGTKNSNAQVLKGIQTLADAIQKDHGDEAFGAMPKLFDAVNTKFKNPENVNKVLYGAMREYKSNLVKGVEEPLNKALAATVDRLPAESSTQSIVYANPLGPILQKMFGKRQTAVLPQSSNPLIKLPESPLSKLTESLEQRNGASNQDAAKAFLNNELNRVKDFVTGLPKFTGQAFDSIKTMTGAAWQAYENRGGLSPFEWALGNRRLELSSNAIVMHEFHDRIMKMHPDNARREAMVNYLQASGGAMSDRDVNAQLQQKANAFAPSSAQNRKLRQGYIDAQNLTPAEKQTIADYRAYDSHLNQQEAAQGLELHARENYIRQIWSKDSFARKQIDAIFSAGSFTVNPSFTRMRKFEDYFEGEQSGFTPHRKDFAYLISARARASAEVLANRALRDSLYNRTMPDGARMAQFQGIGNSQTINDPAYPNLTDEQKKGAIYIKQARPDDAITNDGRPYVVINHPSFQNSKWVGQVKDPTTGRTVEILYKGNMLAHPDVAPQIKRILEPSALRSGMLGQAMKPLLGASSIGKQTLLIGLFHPVQLGIHALEHAAEGSTSANAMNALNPFSSKKFIDLDNNVNQQQLVIHGLKVADYNGESLWDEGVMSHGLASGAPVIGKFLRSIHDTMFSKYIPNLKMAMAEDALGRNMARYHDQYSQEELTKLGSTGQKAFGAASQEAQSRIMRMTAEQMNSAFGGINWDSLPVNKTWQDIARLTVLAPDFLLARMQFVGDALRPGGMESRKALLIGAFVQYTAARAFNAAMNDGDSKWNIHDWNKFIAGKHEFSLRTVQGDLMDSVLDTRKFLSYRANPVTLRPAIEAWSGKDVFGHPVSAGQELMDFAKNVVPMPAQGLFDAAASKSNPGFRNAKSDDTIASTLIQSLVGMHVKQYRTPAERSVFEDFDNIQGPPSTDTLAMEQKNTFRALRQRYQDGKLTDEDLVDALNKPGGNLKESEVRYIFKTAKETQLVTRARHLEFNQVMNAWHKGSLAEKMELTPILRTKSRTLTPDEQAKVQDKLDDFQENLTDEQNEKLHGEIQKELEYEYPPTAEEQGEPQ